MTVLASVFRWDNVYKVRNEFASIERIQLFLKNILLSQQKKTV